jgi:hypothetical protein
VEAPRQAGELRQGNDVQAHGFFISRQGYKVF